MSRAKDRALKAAKEARRGGAFLPFRLDVLRSQALARLSPYAAKLLLDIASQWQLGRNGDASAAFEKVLRARGWRSKATLHNALRVTGVWTRRADTPGFPSPMQLVRAWMAGNR